MATYLPDSNDYIAKTEAYTPDFKFLADALGRRQDRYNSNYKHLNNLYSKVVHADMSHKDNIYKRDEYANLLVPKIQQLTGTDFSLQQNVDAAKALFKPFFEDKQIVRDIVWTKRFSDQMQKANQFRTSGDAKERDRYWQDGVDRLNFSMQDFKEGSVSEIMNHQLPEYVEDPDLIEKGIEYLMNYEGKGKKLEITDVVFDPTGQWMTTMTNGTVLTQRPTGVVDKKTGKMITYNPAANIIAKTILDDPIISRGYATKIYVETRKFYEDSNNIQKYGSKEGAEKFYLQKIIDQTKNSLENENASEGEHIEKLEQTKNSAQKYLESYSKPNSQARKTYDEAIQAIIIANKGIAKNNEIITNINREHKDLPEMRNIAYEAYMNLSINNDVMSAANEYAQTTMKVTERDLNPLYKMQLENSYKVSLENLKHDNAMALEEYKKVLNQPEPIVDLFGGNGMNPSNSNEVYNIPKEIANGNLINYNKEKLQDINISEVREPMFNTIEAMTTKLAAVWSDKDKTFNPNGLNVSVFVYDDGSGWMKKNNPENKSGKMANKFLTWAEAKEYFINGSGRNDDQLENKYKEMLYNYENAAIDNVSLNTPQFDALRKLITNNQTKIEFGQADIISITDDQNTAYQSAFNIVSKQNPELGEFFKKNGNIGEMKDGKLVLHSLSNYQKKVVQQWKANVESVGLPQTLKSIEDFTSEGYHGFTDKNQRRLYAEYLNQVFTPEVLQKLGVNNVQQAISSHYMVDMNAERNNVPKPSNSGEARQDPEERKKMHNLVIDGLQNNMTESYLTTGRLTDNKGKKHVIKLQSNVKNSNLENNSKMAYTNMYDAMNEVMTSASAGKGAPTFNVQNAYMGKPQDSDGLIPMSDNWTGTLLVNNKNKEVESQVMAFFNATRRFDKDQVVVKAGSPETHWKNEKNAGTLEDKTWSENIEKILNQISIDYAQPGKDEPKPNMNITFNENINGMNGLIVQLDNDYIKKLREIEGGMFKKMFKEDQNTITIYVEKGLMNNPLNVNNMVPSSTKKIVQEDGKYYKNFPLGGSYTVWENSQGGMEMQMIERNWVKSKNNEYELKEIIGDVISIPSDQSKYDKLTRTVIEHLQELESRNSKLQDSYER